MHGARAGGNSGSTYMATAPRVNEIIVRYEDGSERFYNGDYAHAVVNAHLNALLELRNENLVFNCPECLHRVQIDEHGACPHNRRA